MTYKSIYINPALDGHNVLYKGKRYWVFEISNEHPYEDYEKDYSIIIFDKLCGGVAAWVNKLSDNTYSGDMSYSQQSIDISGSTIREIVDKVIHWTNWVEKIEK